MKHRRIVDAIGIADQGVGEAAELQEAMPVGIVAREPRDLQADYDADAAECDFGSKSGKAIARHDTGSGNAEILVDDDNLLRRASQVRVPWRPAHIGAASNSRLCST